MSDYDLQTSEGLLRLFQEREALLEGHFLLSSGLHSPRYLQCARVLMDPALATALGAALADRLRPLLGEAVPATVVAPALGGVLVAQVDDGELADRLVAVSLHLQAFIQHAGRAVGAGQAAQGDPSPGRGGLRIDGCQHRA